MCHNIGGLTRDGADGVNEVSYIILKVLDEIHLLQPQANVQISHKTPDRFLKAACRVIRKGCGYPSVFNTDEITMEQLMKALKNNFRGQETLRLRLFSKTPFYCNEDDAADSIMKRVFSSLYGAIDGKPNTKNSAYFLNMLSTTCHIYFGKKLGASANGRMAGMPISDGTSPAHGADRNVPTAVIKSLGKMDQIKTGGTLLNQRFLPDVLEGDGGIEKLAHLIQTYFKLNGHQMPMLANS